MRGITVTLYEKTLKDDPDPFGAPVYTETAVTVDNVLVGQPTTEDIADAERLYGKKIVFVLGIPKGDAHEWQDRRITWKDAYGRTWDTRSFGFPVTGVEENIPGPWHKKVWVEAYG